jgi:predicted amidohydrolase
MTTWKLAAVQMDCRLGDKATNLEAIRARLGEAAGQGARLVVFPECALSGYCFRSRDEALPHAETVPGPSTESLAGDCRRLGVWACVGLLEWDRAFDLLFNAAVLLGPGGEAHVYRKVHLPFLGVDRFTTKGNRRFAVHDLGGLRVGMNICYDGSFPESSRVLALLGADVVLLPTNWPPGAARNPQFVVQTRAVENRIYYAAVNRVGEERGFRFIGQSRIVDPGGDLLAVSDDDRETILYADIDPARARQKRIVHLAGEYEIDRVHDRRPEMYGPITEPVHGADPHR